MEVLNMVQKNYKRALACLLTLAMTLTNVGTDLSVAFAAKEQAQALFQLDGGDLQAAIRDAEASGEAIDGASLQMTGSAALEDSYKELLGGNGASVYELDAEVDDSGAPDGTALQIYYNADTDSVIFLFINDSENPVEFRANVDGYETARVIVDAASADDEDADADTPVSSAGGSASAGNGSASAENGGASAGNSSSAGNAADNGQTPADGPDTETGTGETDSSNVVIEIDGTENSDVEDESNETGSPDVEIKVEETESDETETPDTDTGSGETETPDTDTGSDEDETPDAETGSDDTENSEIEIETDETPSADADTEAGTDDTEDVEVKVEGDETESPAAGTDETDSSDPEHGVSDTDVSGVGSDAGSSDHSDGSTSDDSASDDSASDDSASNNSSSDGGAEGGLDDGFQTASISRNAVPLVMAYEDGQILDEEILDEDILNEDILDEDEILDEDGAVYRGELDGKVYGTITLAYGASARAFVTKAAEITQIPEEDGYRISYTVTPDGQAKLSHETKSVEGGGTASFQVKPAAGYEIAEVRANGVELEPEEIATPSGSSDRIAYQIPDVWADQDVEILVSPVENPDYPAFFHEETVGDVTITISAETGILPAGVSAQIREVTQQVETAVKEKDQDENGEQNIAAVLAYDITLFDKNGVELDNSWSENGGVRVSFTGAKIAEESQNVDEVKVSHLDLGEASVEDGITAEDIQDMEQVGLAKDVSDGRTIDTIGFTAEHFSVYTVTFQFYGGAKHRVEFHVVDVNGYSITNAYDDDIKANETYYTLYGKRKMQFDEDFISDEVIPGVKPIITGENGELYFFKEAREYAQDGKIITHIQYNQDKSTKKYIIRCRYEGMNEWHNLDTSNMKIYLIYGTADAKSKYERGESKWKVDPPLAIEKTTDGIIVKSEVNVDPDYNYIHITIPEDFEGDEININLTEALLETWEGNFYIPAKESAATKIDIQNLSGKTFGYLDGSMEIGTYQAVKPYEEGKDPTYSFENKEGYVTTAKCFDGYVPYYRYSIGRVGNTALCFLYGRTATEPDLLDSAVDAQLKLMGYEKGIEDLSQYYLDFCNSKYGTSHTKLEEFEAIQLCSTIFDGDPGSEYIKESNGEVAELGYNLLYNAVIGIKSKDDYEDV